MGEIGIQIGVEIGIDIELEIGVGVEIEIEIKQVRWCSTLRCVGWCCGVRWYDINFTIDFKGACVNGVDNLLSNTAAEYSTDRVREALSRILSYQLQDCAALLYYTVIYTKIQHSTNQHNMI